MDFSNWLDGIKTLMQDKNWWKKALGLALFALIPIVGPIAWSGALYERVHSVLQGDVTTYPSISGNFERYFMRGLKIYGFSLMIGAVAGLLAIFTFGIGSLLVIPLEIMMMAMVAHFLVNGERFSAFFEFKEIWNCLKNNFEAYLKYFLMSMIYGMATAIVIVPLVIIMEVTFIIPMTSIGSGTDQSVGFMALMFGMPLLMLAICFLIFVISSIVTPALNFYLAEYIRKAYPEYFQTQNSPVVPTVPAPPTPPTAPIQ